MGMTVYRGWHIHEAVAGPVTGRWRAQQHGVRIGAPDRATLERMIDFKISERKRVLDKRV